MTQGRKISEHVAGIVQNRDQMLNELNTLKVKLNEELNTSKKEYEQSKTELTGILKDVEEIKTRFNNTVSNEDLIELVEDIRASFELYLNATPRDKDKELELKLMDMEKRLTELNTKMEAVFGSNEVEVIQNVVKSSSKSVPKLNIKPKK